MNMKVKIEFNGDSYIKASIDNYEVGNLDIYADEEVSYWLIGIEVK